MTKHLREIGAWARLPAALSFIVYGVALELWPAASSRFFVWLFQLDPFWLRPLHGWDAVLPGLLAWLAACYALAAVGWAVGRSLPQLRSLLAAPSRLLPLPHLAERISR